MIIFLRPTFSLSKMITPLEKKTAFYREAGFSKANEQNDEFAQFHHSEPSWLVIILACAKKKDYGQWIKKKVNVHQFENYRHFVSAYVSPFKYNYKD